MSNEIQKIDDIYTRKNLTIFLPSGTEIAELNIHLVKLQKLTSDEIELLKLSHIHRFLLIQAMTKTSPANINTLLKLMHMVEEAEFTQQELWRFPKDRNFHQWFRVPHCTCPVNENDKLFGEDGVVIEHTCILHGNVNHV